MRRPGERGTRERILEVAESFLGEHGYEGTRLHQVAERVGIQKASLFHYFSSKEDLYRSVIEEGFTEAEQTIHHALTLPGTWNQRVHRVVAAYVDLVAAHPARTKILLRQSLGDAPDGYQSGDAERLLRSVAAVVEAAQRERDPAPLDPLALVLGIAGMVAFFFTSASVLVPGWVTDPFSTATIARVKQHCIDVIERCLNLDAAGAAGVPAMTEEPLQCIAPK